LRILVALADQAGQSYWRQIMPLSRLPEHTVLFTDVLDPAFFLSADLVVTSRVSTQPMLDLLKTLKAAGKPTIQDFDDHLHQLQHNPEARSVYGTGQWGTRIFEEALPIATVVTASTRRLADEYAKWRPGIEVVENFISDEAFARLSPSEITGKPKREGEIRIGYAGSSTHGGDLALIARPLRKLCARYPEVKLVFFGQPPTLPGVDPARIELHGYIDPELDEQPFAFMDRYFDRVKSLDLDVEMAPLVPNVFNASKSFLRLLQAGACGNPVVASSYGPYREYRERGGPIIPCFDEREWLERLSMLVRHTCARRDFAKENHAYVREHHTSAVGLAAWRRVIALTAESRALCGAG
jgi:glycosyltransferase involved in cell wall biosynthesis